MSRLYTLQFEYATTLPRTARRALERVLMRSPVGQQDKNTLLLAVTELISNLVRHSEQKPSQVSLECRWTEHLLQIRLQDNGSAIPPSVHTPDLDLNSLLAGDVQSGGYGLAMLYAAFDPVVYHSYPTGVNQWTLSLKLQPTESLRHILLVDDDTVQLELLKHYLEPHTISAFSSPVEALAWLRNHQPDLILSDICMPELDGLNFRHQVSELAHLQLTPFIFLTGDSDEALAQNIAHAGTASNGIDDYILKPITQEQIKRISDRVLHRHQDLLKRSYALIDYELKHHLRPPLAYLNHPHYRLSSLAFSAHLGGGDYWLAKTEGAQLQVLLGDVMGHDLQSCFMAGRQQGFFQALTEPLPAVSPSHNPPLPNQYDPGQDYLSRFSSWLDRYQPELLTTLSLIIADSDNLCFYNAGAPPPWLLTTEGGVASVPKVGVLPGLGCDGDFTPFRLQLQPGERLVLFSDGLIEVSHRYADQQQRISDLIALLSNHNTLTLTELTEQLDSLIQQAPISDDTSVIIIETSAK